MGKGKQILSKLEEITEQLNRIEEEAAERDLTLDERIEATAKKLETLLIEKCERDGIAAVAGSSFGVGIGVSTGPLQFFAGPDPDVPDSVPSDWN